MYCSCFKGKGLQCVVQVQITIKTKRYQSHRAKVQRLIARIHKYTIRLQVIYNKLKV